MLSLHGCVYTICILGAWGNQKVSSDPLKRQLQMVVSLPTASPGSVVLAFPSFSVTSMSICVCSVLFPHTHTLFFRIVILGFILSADLIMLGLFKSSATLHFHLGPQLILVGEFDCRGFISENYRLCWWLLRRARDGTTSASLSSQLNVQISGLFISIHKVSTMNLRKCFHGALYNIVRISCRCALCISSTTIPSLQYLNL